MQLLSLITHKHDVGKSDHETGTMTIDIENTNSFLFLC